MQEVIRNDNDIAAIVDLANGASNPFQIEGVPAMLVPRDTKVQLFPEYLKRPIQLVQKVRLDTQEAFIRYYNEFSTSDSVIFCDLRAGTFTAVLDYHEDPSSASWCSHVATYACPQTPEWAKWKSHSGRWMQQEEFALFIEENQEEIIQPTGADMLETALTLQAKTDVNFRRGIRLDNGQIQLTYQETIEGRAGAQGNLNIPATIKIGLQLFEGGKGYELEARFRYRVKDGHLAMSYELIRAHKAHEAAIQATYQAIMDAMNDGLLLRGSHT